MDTITVGSTADFAVTIPYQLGYHPTQSLAVVGLAGKEVVGIMRIDLCEPDRAGAGASCLRTFVRAGVDGVIMVAFEARAGQGAALLRSFRAGATGHGMAVRDCLIVRHGEWFGVTSAGNASGRGRRLPDASRVPAVAEFVARGRSPLPDRASLSTLVDDEGTAISRAVGARVRALASVLEHPDPPASPASTSAWGPLLADAAPPLDDDEVVADALLGLLDRQWRDGLLAWLCPDTLGMDLLPDDVLRGLRGIPRPAAASDDHDGIDEVGDEVGRRLLALCRLVPDDAGEVTAGILTVAAHVAWCDGDGALASVALERALRVAPTYRLAQLLDCLVAAGVRASDSRARPPEPAPGALPGGGSERAA